MGFWQERVVPTLVLRGMQNKVITEYRPRIPSLARRRVLEVGIGNGLNIPYYGSEVEHLFGLDPSRMLLDDAGERAAAAPFPVELIEASAADIPLESDSIDTVVSTWTLCSIPDIETAMQEMRRVLKPDGRLLFIEHGRSPDAHVARWQNRLTPVFRALAGCRLNRVMDELIAAAGFELVDLEKSYLDGPRLLAYHYIGQAAPR